VPLLGGREKGTVFWLLLEKLEKLYRLLYILRYSKEETHAFAHAGLEMALVSDTARMKFSDLWEEVQLSALLAVEEGFLEEWTLSRIVCTGDSVHKVCSPEEKSVARFSLKETNRSLQNLINKSRHPICSISSQLFETPHRQLCQQITHNRRKGSVSGRFQIYATPPNQEKSGWNHACTLALRTLSLVPHQSLRRAGLADAAAELCHHVTSHGRFYLVASPNGFKINVGTHVDPCGQLSSSPIRLLTSFAKT